MKIKSKIIISNIFMVGIPIICAGILGSVGFRKIDSKYMYSLDQMFADENAVISAQSTIYAYQEELWNTNWKQMEEEEIGHQDEKGETIIKWSELQNSKNELIQNTRLYNLGQEMENMGYHFSVFMNGDCQYSNLTSRDSDIIQQIAGDAITHVRSMVVGENNASVIKNSFENGDTVCVIIAVNSGNKTVNPENISYLKQKLLRFVVLYLLVILVIIVLTNGGLSGYILRTIMKPLNKLKEGTRRIHEGDLDTPIKYTQKDEFGDVCDDFEKMRHYLKKTALERLEYENYRREMISGISHDLRTPLTSIKGYTEGLMMGIADSREMQERYFQAIAIRTRDLEQLVNNLSFYNKVENKILKYEREKFDFKEFLAKYLDDRALELEREKVKVHLNAKEKYDVFLDRKELIRVFDNFISNTIKYRKTNTSLVFISLDRVEEKVICTYEDDAGGIPEEALERIFDSFYRTDMARSRTGEGSGLGLSIVKAIITAQGGRIRAENGESGLKIIIEVTEGDGKDESIDR